VKYDGKWTLENGHCVDENWIENNLTEMNDFEKCVFYLKCKLTDSTSADCDNVTHHFHSLCQNKTIKYPSEPVLKPYLQTIYELAELRSSKMPNFVYLNGSIKCIGYQALFKPQEIPFNISTSGMRYRLDSFFCRYGEKIMISSSQFDQNCWNNTKQSFLCQTSLQCISKHRLRNGVWDCAYHEDESDNQKCYMKNRHRFNCSGESPTCLLVSIIGDAEPNCDNGKDEYIAQLKWTLFDRKCRKPNSIECNNLKTYIQSSSSLLTENSKVLVFRHYCDTLWQLPRGFDESLCNEWKCPRDQYQCLTGHCLSIEYVDTVNFEDWHCPDASDNIRLIVIKQLNKHNARLISNSKLQSIQNILIYYNSDIYTKPFTKFCDSTEEYGCILANVNDPLNFTINRPCINLTKISDGIIDCYGGLDERNLLTCGNNNFEQRGFDFHCSDEECIPFYQQCLQRCSNKADSLLCDQLETLWNSSCQYPIQYGPCRFSSKNKKCDPFQIRNYYCDEARPSK
jgi:hypothetical protein